MNTFSIKVFLLGACDLEMLTIKQILDCRDGCVVVDKQLDWHNAFLSAFKEDIPLYCDYDIYGIELQEDIPVPKNYHRIDHHNDWENKPSALEQIASILGLELNRYQQLVAANDRGYIPEMLSMSATNQEIDMIRRADRLAQGVSEEEEQMAEDAIANAMSLHGSLIVVKSPSSHFSPICDRLYPFKHLLVYNDAEWVFYGEGKKQLVGLLAGEIKKNNIYHGGSDMGFIGAAKGCYDKETILRFVKRIVQDYECV